MATKPSGALQSDGSLICSLADAYPWIWGKDWDWISEADYGRVSREAIAEAVGLASDALLEKMGERRRAA